MSEDETITCRKCSQPVTVRDSKLDPGRVRAASCPKCKQVLVYARCQSCETVTVPESYRCERCIESSSRSEGPTEFAAANDGPSLARSGNSSQRDKHQSGDQSQVISEIRDLKVLIRSLEAKVATASSAPAQLDKAISLIEKVETKLSREIANAQSAAIGAQRETEQHLATIAGKVDNSAKKTLEQIQDTCKAIIDGMQDGANSTLENDVAPSINQIAERLKQLRNDLAAIQVWTQDALQGPGERRFPTLSKMVEFWTKSLGRKVGKDIQSLTESASPADKKQKAGESKPQHDSPAQHFYLDVAGMTRLLGAFGQERGLEIIRDLPELFNSVDDRLREKRRLQADEPDNESVTETIDTLVRVQLRMRAWQEQNELVRLPREDNELLDYRYHFAVGTAPTADQELDRRVKEVKTTGYAFSDGTNELVLQKAEVVVWEFVESSD